MVAAILTEGGTRDQAADAHLSAVGQTVAKESILETKSDRSTMYDFRNSRCTKRGGVADNFWACQAGQEEAKDSASEPMYLV